MAPPLSLCGTVDPNVHNWQLADTQLDEAALTLANPREFFTSLAVLGPCSPLPALALPLKHPVSSVQIQVEPVHTQLSSRLQQGISDETRPDSLDQSGFIFDSGRI